MSGKHEPDPTDDDALTRFASLVKKLVQVPKREIDAERAKERKRKEKKDRD
jgi:hypothetical protein